MQTKYSLKKNKSASALFLIGRNCLPNFFMLRVSSNLILNVFLNYLVVNNVS